MSDWDIQQPKPQTVTTSAKVRPEILEELKVLAKKHGLSVSNVAAQCIEQGLKGINQ